MESYQKELEEIKRILRENPKGMTVTDISRKIKVNRNSVAKYLDILLISGQAEMVTFGPAKVFFPSRRVPISKMLNFSSDYILILDRDLKIVQVNDRFLDFIEVKRELLKGQRIEDLDIQLLNNPEILDDIQEVISQKTSSKETNHYIEEEDLYFKTKTITTSFEDGGQGVAIIINNITDQKRIENALKQSEQKFKELFKQINTMKKQ